METTQKTLNEMSHEILVNHCLSLEDALKRKIAIQNEMDKKFTDQFEDYKQQLLDQYKPLEKQLEIYKEHISIINKLINVIENKNCCNCSRLDDNY